MADERITADEWDKRRACPICIDIADKAIPMDGEVMKDETTGDPLPCPQCGHKETRLFHAIGASESKRTSARGDTQVWSHLLTVKCMSCPFSHVVANNICLGEPWEEVFGFKRKLDQTEGQGHAIKWSNEQAVGLRGAKAKYDKGDKLFGRGHRAKRKIETTRAEGKGKVEWVPTKEEKKLPKFRDKPKE